MVNIFDTKPTFRSAIRWAWLGILLACGLAGCVVYAPMTVHVDGNTASATVQGSKQATQPTTAPVNLGREETRSPRWAAVRKAHLRAEPACAWCGATNHLQVHHVIPFHIRPDLELVDSNLITLCERPGVDCHLVHGHNGNFKLYNPNVRADCLKHRAGLLVKSLATSRPAGG